MLIIDSLVEIKGSPSCKVVEIKEKNAGIQGPKICILCRGLLFSIFNAVTRKS